jgi:hypothetical protein
MARKKRAGAKTRAKRGIAAAGTPMRPTALPPDSTRVEAEHGTRSAPAPGVPMSHQEYERLKKQAETAPAPDAASAQEDLPWRRGVGSRRSERRRGPARRPPPNTG